MQTAIRGSKGNVVRAYRVFTGRVGYAQEVSALKRLGERLLKAGKDEETVARALHASRRNIGIKYKNRTPADQLAEIRARNVKEYGDPLGPTIDYLRNKRKKSWQEIIESASRIGGGDLGLK